LLFITNTVIKNKCSYFEGLYFNEVINLNNSSSLKKKTQIFIPLYCGTSVINRATDTPGGGQAIKLSQYNGDCSRKSL